MIINAARSFGPVVSDVGTSVPTPEAGSFGQRGQHPAASILATLQRKDVNKIDDETLIHADTSRKAVNQVREAMTALLTGRGMDPEAAQKPARTLSEGRWTHDYPITDEDRQGHRPASLH